VIRRLKSFLTEIILSATWRGWKRGFTGPRSMPDLYRGNLNIHLSTLNGSRTILNFCWRGLKPSTARIFNTAIIVYLNSYFLGWNIHVWSLFGFRKWIKESWEYRCENNWAWLTMKTQCAIGEYYGNVAVTPFIKLTKTNVLSLIAPYFDRIEVFQSCIWCIIVNKKLLGIKW
jgi:hypothetical protein